MSLRTAFSRIYHQGKWVLKKLVGKSKFVKPVKGGQNIIEVKRQPKLFKTDHTQQGPRLFSSILKKYAVNTLAGDLRRKAAWQFGNGRLPIFSFGLLGLALVNRSEEDDYISQSVRDMFTDHEFKSNSERENGHFLSVNMLDFGKAIGKGCNAAVYEVRLKKEAVDITDVESDIQILDEEIALGDQQREITLDNLSDSQQEVDHRRETTLCNSSNQETFSDSLSSIGDKDDDDIIIISDDDTSINSDDSFEIVSSFQVECLSPVEAVSENLVFDSHSDTDTTIENMEVDEGDFDHAVKMMFNYDIDSNTEAIMHAFRKETIPAHCDVNVASQRHCTYRKLPPHPNIVEMQDVFVDMVPDLPNGIVDYPIALPERLNPEGQGRNKTMFILMKKYTMTLRDFLNNEDEPSIHTRCVLLTQILEGIVHLRKHEIAHRDLKSDNIFLDINEGDTPQLVISDFGCCLADINYGLKIPYQTNEIDRGGTPTLMAPEIACAVPGRESWLDYRRADLWTVGTLVYELFGMENPFMDGKDRLDCRTYLDSNLPSLPEEVPDVVKLLAESMLKRDPKQRPSPEDAANLMQIYLWFPEWLTSDTKPTKYDMINNLLILASKVLIGCYGNGLKTLDRLQWTFLKRFNFRDIKHLLNL